MICDRCGGTGKIISFKEQSWSHDEQDCPDCVKRTEDHNKIWNEAIEAAAKFMDDKGQSKHTLEATVYHQDLANEIRKLKRGS